MNPINYLLKRIKLYTLIFIISCLSTYTYAQKYFIEVNSVFGEIIPHYSYLKKLKSPIDGYNIRAGFQTNNSYKWYADYNFPQIGLGMSFLNFNSAIIGKAKTNYAFLTIPIVHTRKFFTGFDLSTGIGYGFNKYDMLKNPENDMISSPINYHFNLKILAKYEFIKNIMIQSAFSLGHFCNGALFLPQAGMNFYTFESGIVYTVSKKDEKKNIVFAKELPSSSIYLEFVTSYSKIKMIDKNTTYYGGSFSSILTRRISNINRIGIGLDLLVDEELSKAFYPETSANQKLQSCISGVHNFDFGNLSFICQYGFYTKKRIKEQSLFFQGIGLRYLIANNLLLNFSAKIEHFRIAKFTEFGIGYRINFKQKSEKLNSLKIYNY